MTSISLTSTLARAYQTRLANNLLKTRIEAASKEVTTGVKADVAKHLRGDLSNVNQITARSAALKTYRLNAIDAQSRLSAIQSGLEALQTSITSTGADILAQTATASKEALLVRAGQGKGRAISVFNALNQRVAGQSLFAGSNTSSPALRDPSIFLAQVDQIAATHSSATDIRTALQSWLDAPAGAGGFTDSFYLGNDAAAFQIPLDETEVISSDLRATAPAFRDMLLGAALQHVAFERRETIDIETLRALSLEAGRAFVSADSALTQERGRVGFRQEAAENAFLRIDAENQTLDLALSKNISTDPFEAAQALENTQTQLETLYQITARLNQLSLVDFLK